MVKRQGTVLAIVLALAFHACGPVVDAEGSEEVQQTRVRPRGDVEAQVVLHSGGGAAGWLFWAVDVIDPSTKKRDTVLQVSHGQQPNVEWVRDDLLRVTVQCGDISGYTNRSYIARNLSAELIEIELVGGRVCGKL